MFELNSVRVGVVGLGYVGLPLAVEFAKHFPTVGFDVKARRVDELRHGIDTTLEVTTEQLRAAPLLIYSTTEADLSDCNFYVVTVPTPINDYKQPDLGPLEAASRTVGKVIGHGDVVVFESTVYPGATEEVCVPIIEAVSGLRYNVDFFAGYSPERVNPGDKEHTVTAITKVTSGSTPEAAAHVDAVYRTIIAAGTYQAESIRVAEAAKVIENTQRDVNIALINELALLFNRMGLDTDAVLRAAGTKWNFLPFRPGLVGGHCIGVDPYYLTYKAQSMGHHPEMILAGRRINDCMGEYVARRVMQLMTKRRICVAGSRVLVLGLTFKENCPDLRNTRVIDIIAQLREYDAVVDVYDPWADPAEAHHEYGLTPIGTPEPGGYDTVIVAVAHRQFREMGIDTIRGLTKPGGVVFDVKYLFAAEAVDGRL